MATESNVGEIDTLLRCIEIDARYILEKTAAKDEFTTFEAAARLVAKRSLRYMELTRRQDSPEKSGPGGSGGGPTGAAPTNSKV